MRIFAPNLVQRHMYINAIGHFVPQGRVSNEYIKQLNGLEADWIVQRTGIFTRSKLDEGQNDTFMAISAAQNAADKLTYDAKEVDLIVSAGYSITDTVGTTAHRVQKHFGIENAQAVAVTSACSSMMNAIEIVEGYFATGKARKALVVCADANSVYNDYSNPKSGHLWGDAAAALFLSVEPASPHEPQIVDVLTKALAHIGKGPDGVCLYPNDGGIAMHDGRDVFHYACSYMPSTMEELLARNQMEVSEVDYFACHQANLRIVNHIASQWGLPESRFFNNIRDLGNTGSASAMVALSQNAHRVGKGQTVGLVAFGGGYSSGALLMRF